MESVCQNTEYISIDGLNEFIYVIERTMSKKIEKVKVQTPPLAKAIARVMADFLKLEVDQMWFCQINVKCK